MNLYNPFADGFGIDIGDLSIKLVQLEPVAFYRRQSFKIKELRTTPLPPGLIVNGEIQQPEPVRKKLLHLLGLEGKSFKTIHSPWVVATLPEPKTFLKLIDIDINYKSLTSVDVAYQAKKHLPYELEDTYLDWQIITSTLKEKRTQILIAATPKIIADSYTYLLESVGLNPVALETEAVAMTRSMITYDKDYTGQARAILDLGATRSNLTIYDNHSIQFSTTLNFSGEIITSAIAQELKMEHSDAEALKIKNGLKYDAKNPNYLTAVSGITDKLISELKATLLFYKEHFNDINEVNRITLCGGTANLENIDTLISKELKIDAQAGHPWKNLENKKLYDFEPKKSLSLASAIGLALRIKQNPLQDQKNENI
ncbi:MAG: type IV pilus assembly protein PilM [Candidatus Magasanikbacteria bacterium]|nr:type IV pilus assembly protein PilM [Candidatus Magasanikbacteria bacterium]